MESFVYRLHLIFLVLYAQLTVLNGDRQIALRLNGASAFHFNLAPIADTHLGREGAGLVREAPRPDINFDSSCWLHFKIHSQRFCGTEGEDTPEHDALSSSFLALYPAASGAARLWRFGGS